MSMSEHDSQSDPRRDFRPTPINNHPEVRARYQFREPILLQDFTFGKMDHLYAGRMYSVDEYREVAGLLDEIGMPLTTFQTDRYAGTPKDSSIWRGFKAVAEMSRRKLKLQANALLETWPQHGYSSRIDQMIDAGADSILFATMPEAISGRPKSDLADRLVELPKAIEYAKKKGIHAALTTFDWPSEQLDVIVDRLNHYIEFGMDAVELSDSTGRASLEATRFVVETVVSNLKRNVPIWYHAHDNFGLATAQALAAASAGAWPQVAVNGIGDNGFASLEEVAIALELLYDVRTGLRLQSLHRLCSTVERITGITTPRTKAVSGQDLRLPDDSQRYIAALEGRDWDQVVAGAFDPQLVGSSIRPIMSYAVLTEASVRAKLADMGLPTDQAVVDRARGALRDSLDDLGNTYPVFLDDSQVERICRDQAAR